MYARRSCITIDDRMLMAEILNNLGCLAYMCGQPVAANGFYRDSMDVQFGVLSDSLYAGNATWGQTISLNISITRANIGFIKLVTKELPVAITALENALMEQQILLKGGHETVIATMDHLAVANLLYGDQEKAALVKSLSDCLVSQWRHCFCFCLRFNISSIEFCRCSSAFWTCNKPSTGRRILVASLLLTKSTWSKERAASTKMPSKLSTKLLRCPKPLLQSMK